MESSISTKKSQIWGLDLTIAFLIFVGALFIFYKYSINAIDIEKQDVSDIVLDAKLISSYLISTGYPENWDTTNVTLIGLTDGEMRIKKNKVQEFSDIASLDYTRSRRLLSTTHDYYVYFENSKGNLSKIGNIEGIGKNYMEQNSSSLVKLVRFVFYNSSIIKLVVYVW